MQQQKAMITKTLHQKLHQHATRTINEAVFTLISSMVASPRSCPCCHQILQYQIMQSQSVCEIRHLIG